MIHVCPPQCAPDFIRASELADSGGWINVDQATLRHKQFTNIWSLGDVTNTPNAKSAAAARKQAPVVAANVVADITGKPSVAAYSQWPHCNGVTANVLCNIRPFVCFPNLLRLVKSSPSVFLREVKSKYVVSWANNIVSCVRIRWTVCSIWGASIALTVTLGLAKNR